jgi:hypothetical protein
MKIREIILGLAFMVCCLFACQNKAKDQIDPDVAKPKITIENTSASLESGTLCGAGFNNILRIKTGTTLSLKMKLEASVPLSQYKIDAHNNFDCHTHGRMEASPWRLLKIVTLSGTSQTITENIEIPQDVLVGNYHFMINLLDVKGNQSEFVEYNLVLTNSEDNQSPSLSLSSPLQDTTSFAKGSVVTFAGIITDNTSLKNGSVEISYFNPAGTRFDVIQTVFPASTTTSLDLFEVFTLPSNLTSGLYKFVIKAYDEKNNSAEKYKWISIP